VVSTEMIRGKDIAGMGGSVRESAVVSDADLADENQLGRIHTSTRPDLDGSLDKARYRRVQRLPIVAGARHGASCSRAKNWMKQQHRLCSKPASGKRKALVPSGSRGPLLVSRGPLDP